MVRRSWTVGNSSPDPARPVRRSFYSRPTVEVARDLLGRTFEVRGPDATRSVQLVEVEAYLTRDPASHAFRGPTARNRSMFLPPGTLYVFRIHQVVCANLVTRPGEAVLLRAGAPLDPPDGNPSGPGRLCRYLGITLADDGIDTIQSSRAWVTVGNPRDPKLRVRSTPRIGISRGVERRLRFSLAGNPWVSRPRPAGRAT